MLVIVSPPNRLSRAAHFWLWFVVVALARPPVDVLAQASVADDEVVDRAGEYVQQLRTQLALVISDEVSKQEVQSWMGRRFGVRTLRSERLLSWLPDELVWLSIRNVLVVDGRSIPDSKQRLERALTDSTPGAMSPTSAVAGRGRSV
jgi:hypothetical protein